MDLQFGEYRLKRQERVVSGPNGPVDLSARAFDILNYLLGHHGEVVEKNTLLEAVWPGVVVEDNTLQVHIAALRKALGPEVIATVHGRGYKYAGPPPEAYAAVIKPQMSQKPVIAVLPFENLSGDPEQQYFSEGITVDITERLTRFRAFAVIGHHSARALRDVTDFPAIRETLKADFVVSGSVRRAGGRLRIAVRLANALTGELIWAQHYDRPVEDLFEVQDEVAHLVAAAVARLLEIEITARSGAKHPANFSSYEHILRGHWHFRQVTIASNLAARASFERASQIDPGSAEAMSWLGVTYSNNWINVFALEDAKRGAGLCAEAVNLDPADGHCHAMLGFAELCVNNLDAAVRASDRAVSLNSGDSNILANRAYAAAYEGHTVEARQLLDRALTLNPVPPIWFGEFGGLIDFVEGRYESALAGVEPITEPAWDNMYVLACCGHLAYRDKALQAKARLERLGPNVDPLAGASREPYRDASVRERLIAGITKALAF